MCLPYSKGNYVTIKELFVIACAQSSLFCAVLIVKVIKHGGYKKLGLYGLYFMSSALFLSVMGIVLRHILVETYLLNVYINKKTI